MKVLVCGYSRGEFVPDGAKEPIIYYSLYVLEPQDKPCCDGYLVRRAKMTKGAYDAICSIFKGDITNVDVTVDFTGRVTNITEV